MLVFFQLHYMIMNNHWERKQITMLIFKQCGHNCVYLFFLTCHVMFCYYIGDKLSEVQCKFCTSFAELR